MSRLTSKIIVSAIWSTMMLFSLLPVISSRADDMDIITFNTQSPDGTLTQEEAALQLADAGLTAADSFVACFDSSVTGIGDAVFAGLTGSVEVYAPKSVIIISPDSGLGNHTTMYVFAGSAALEYAEESGVAYKILPTVLTDTLPEGYQYLPYSFYAACSEGSWLEATSPLPLGLQIAADNSNPQRLPGEIWGAPLEAGVFEIKLKASDGHIYPVPDDEITLTINVLPFKTAQWTAALNGSLIDRTQSNYSDIASATGLNTMIVFDTNPEDKILVFVSGYVDFIDLWMDGVQLTRDVLGNRAGDYTSQEGSTIITVYGQTLGQLDKKSDHVIAGEFKIGGLAEGEQYKAAQYFVINVVSRPKKDTDNDSADKSKEYENGGEIENGGENINREDNVEENSNGDGDISEDKDIPPENESNSGTANESNNLTNSGGSGGGYTRNSGSIATAPAPAQTALETPDAEDGNLADTSTEAIVDSAADPLPQAEPESVSTLAPQPDATASDTLPRANRVPLYVLGAASICGGLFAGTKVVIKWMIKKKAA